MGIAVSGQWNPWDGCSRSICLGPAKSAMGPCCSAATLSHVFVHLTDPQLGMQTMYSNNPKEWSMETGLLEDLAIKVAHLAPKPLFLFVGGDMQNWWPNEVGVGRNHNAHVPDDDLFINGQDLGHCQREDVKRALEVVKRCDVDVVYTPGNHDVGDKPDDVTMRLYAECWGEHQQLVAQADGVMYLQLNSQLYFDAEYLEEAKHAQNTWLDVQLSRVGQDTKLLVFLCHIPPFLNSADEHEGWSNWKIADRKEVFGMITAKLKDLQRVVPVFWICGHFHNNVRNDCEYEGVPVRLRVSSAAGTTLHWDGYSELTPLQAECVACKNVAEAFKDHIVSGDPKNLGERVQPSRTRSGMRIFRVYSDGSVQDQWFTVDDFPKEIPGAPIYVDDLFSQERVLTKGSGV